MFFKKWIVTVVGCVIDDKIINPHSYCGISVKQGLGKTT
jgi:hypothetical protein